MEPSGAASSGEGVLQDSLEVCNSLGLHARVAARIAETVQRYDCQVMLSKDGMEADGGSVLSILALDAPQGSRVQIAVRGKSAKEALEALSGLFASGFGER